MAKSKKVWRGRAVYERLLAERDRDGLSSACPAMPTDVGVPRDSGRRFRPLGDPPNGD